MEIQYKKYKVSGEKKWRGDLIETVVDFER